MVWIEGGTFAMGGDNNQARADEFPKHAVQVSGFFMDETEVTNIMYTEYLFWLKTVFPPEDENYKNIYTGAIPDTLVWRNRLGYNETMTNNYLRHPAYAEYPVVGVNWIQATEFSKWRTDRVNEAILVREGILKWHFADEGSTDVGAANDANYDKRYASVPQNMFSTENYLNGNYTVESEGGYVMNKDNKPKAKVDAKTKRSVPRDPYQLENYDPIYADLDNGRLGTRPVRMEDGILLPSYRLPTEAEWEFAALGLIGNLDEGSENINDRRIYPWDGHYVRQEEEQFAGAIQANFVRGKGDMMGVSGNLNDGSDITARVDDYWPNDFGLYNMAGNVSEWVMDVYRPMTSEVSEEFMPFRGNKYQTQLLVPNGLYDRPVKANENVYDVHGMKEFVNEFARVKYLAYANKKYGQTAGTNYQSNFTNGTVDTTANANAAAAPKPSGVNNNPMNSRIYSKQDPRGYQFNSPSSYYVSNNSQFTSQERLQFEFLDTLNIMLDTAIALYNQGRTIAASAFIERVLFNKDLPMEIQDGSKKQDILELMGIAFDRTDPNAYLGIDTALFSKDYLERKFRSYSTDPTITTWIMTLRNGLTEFITETKGKQRWRDVTVEENAGRLNYRKDDYIDYMDGDLESSIFYNNTKRKDDINSGLRDSKQVMYQNQHENFNLNNDMINAGASGWPTTLISDKSRVYKGGSWADRVYWLSSGNRRFLDEDKATATIGFRCAMDRVGSSRPKSPKE